MTLAQSSGAAIIGFNVRAHKEAREAAERAGIEIRYYNIIYDLVDDVKKAMSGLLTPELRETMLGNAQILEVFNVSKVGKVAGCRVTDGRVERGASVRLIRDNVVVHEGKLSPAQALQGRRARGARPARNAAWPSRTTRTCGRATSSSAIGWRRFNARSESESQAGATLSPLHVMPGLRPGIHDPARTIEQRVTGRRHARP